MEQSNENSFLKDVDNRKILSPNFNFQTPVCVDVKQGTWGFAKLSEK